MTKGKMQLKNTGTSSENYRVFKAKPHYSDDYFPKSILNIPQVRIKGGHPTQKPVALFEYLIKTYTNEGQTVLDNCAGSFTTSVACINTNREFICVEKDEEFGYYDKGKKRIEDRYLELKQTAT